MDPSSFLSGRIVWSSTLWRRFAMCRDFPVEGAVFEPIPVFINISYDDIVAGDQRFRARP
jgi:hypothetical protein